MLLSNGMTTDPAGKAESVRSPMITRRQFIRALIAMSLGIAMTALSALYFVQDDPIPRPGTRYRGLPFAFVKQSPFDDPNAAWKIRPWVFLLDVGVWTFLVAIVQILANEFTEARTDRLRDSGKCEHCEYDLQGSESGTCPECGKSIPSVATKKRQ